MPDEQLVPVFIPPLANMLAQAELKKKSPLTLAEIETIRDKSACIMMELADAKKMDQSRGFIDVNPENCWADWHRLRVQMTGIGYRPQIILCVPGDDSFRARAEGILKARKIEHEFRSHEPKLTQAFRASSFIAPFPLEDYDLIDSHTTVLYVLTPNLNAAEAPVAAREFLSLARKLLEAGGFAVKCEGSGISHSRSRWLELDRISQKDAIANWLALFNAFVILPLSSADDLHSCGMHLLGAADMIIAKSDLRPAKDQAPASAAYELFYAFGVYLLSECPTGTFAPGHTFSADADSPRYRASWEPCTGYAEDDLFFNPFGRWRFSAA